MHTMKARVTLTMDPDVVKKAKRIAHLRHTSVSALIEDFVRRTPVSSRERRVGFVELWSGRFRVRKAEGSDARLEFLKTRYGLANE